MNITKFRKKPVVIEAVRWSGNNLREVINFTGLHPSANKWSWEEYEQVVAREGLKIFTLEGPLIATEGDWIIRGLRGEYYPCKCDIFEATYDPADATSELDRLTADRQLESDIDLPPGVLTLKREYEQLKAALAEKDAEIEKVTHERDLWENMAAMRLADQEAIERHVTKRVAGEIVDIMNHCETFQDVKAVIWQKYGVE